MLFNTIGYALFLPLVFTLYWSLGQRKRVNQNIILLIASYTFYGFWDWRFLFLLIFSTLLDYYTGIRIGRSASSRGSKTWLCISVVINLGFLATFKYFDFFATNFSSLVANFGFRSDPVLLHVILPVGISFYTFHGLSYVIDIYKKKIEPTENFIDYSVFVSFFPLLVAGPIERATHLLPQIKVTRIFNYGRAVDGLRQILWGIFKKVVIADNCAAIANVIFDHPEQYHGPVLLTGAIAFAVQIYGDFSGYSDIALGSARLFNIELLKNFSFPYFSRSIAEFWRRWHISLSSWFRDYVYIPLGGSQVPALRRIINVFIIFILSGFWHGANWTFIFWGLLNAIFILPSVLLGTNRSHLGTVAQGKLLPSAKEGIQIASTFLLTVFAWIFFRSRNLTLAFLFIQNIFAGPWTSLFQIPELEGLISFHLLLIVAGFFIVEWVGRERQYALEGIGDLSAVALRWTIYVLLVFTVLIYSGKPEQFIYFQF